MLLLIHYLLLLPLGLFFVYLILVLLCGSLCPIYFNNQLAEEESAYCFTLIMLWLSVCLPHGAMRWSAVSDCGISWSYQIAVLLLIINVKLFYLSSTTY